MNPTQPLEEGPITNVRASTWNYLNHKIPLKFYGYSLLMVATSIIGVGLAQDLRILVFTIGIYATWITGISNRIEVEFMEQFAALNHLDYQPTADLYSTTGRVLSNGHNQTVTSVISGWLNKLPYQLFLFTTIVGEGRNQTTIKNTVMEIPMGKNVPNVFAVSLKPTSPHWWQTNILPQPKTDYSLHLEGNFDDYYQIQIDPGEEAIAMQIFEPNLMAKLIDTPYRYDFELLDQTLFIYTYRFISTKAELDSFYKFGDLISRQVYNEVETMSVTDEAALPRPKQLWPVGQVIINGLTVIFLSTGVVGLILAALIALTGNSNSNIPPLASTCAVITLIGIILLTYAKQLKH